MRWLRSIQTGEEHKRSEKKPDSRWLLSLADLVTLLLAVTAVSLTAGKLEYLPPQSGGSPVGGSGVGIVLAPTEGEVVGRTVFLFAEQFNGESLEISGQAAKLLEMPENCSGECSFLVEVMSCSPQLDQAHNGVWHQSLLRLLTLHRHLFDGERVGESRVKMTSLGSRCDLLGFVGEENQQPVMAVRFLNTERE